MGREVDGDVVERANLACTSPVVTTAVDDPRHRRDRAARESAHLETPGFATNVPRQKRQLYRVMMAGAVPC
jgi:hypothetical protein